MQLPTVPAKTLPLDRGERRDLGRERARRRKAALAFLALCLLVTLGATHSIDWWGQTAFASLSSSLLDVTAFLLSLLGEGHVTGVVAVVLAVRGWQRQREYGLGPLLLFVGVGVEVLLKTVVPHPGPPAAFARPLHVPTVLSCLPHCCSTS